MDEVLVGEKAVLVMLRLPFSRRKTCFHMIGYSRRSVPVLVFSSPRVSGKVHGLGSASDTTSVLGTARRDGRRRRCARPSSLSTHEPVLRREASAILKYAAVVYTSRSRRRVCLTGVRSARAMSPVNSTRWWNCFVMPSALRKNWTTLALETGTAVRI